MQAVDPNALAHRSLLAHTFLCATNRARCRKYGSAKLAVGSKERSFGSPSHYKSISSATLGTLRALASVMHFPRA